MTLQEARLIVADMNSQDRCFPSEIQAEAMQIVFDKVTKPYYTERYIRKGDKR